MSINSQMTRKDMFSPLDLQRAVMDAVGRVLEDVPSTNEEGVREHGFHGFLQQLPIFPDSEDDSDRYFPYFIVRLEAGDTEEDTEPWTVAVSIYVGIHDDGTDNQGHETLLLALSRIVDRFSREATLGASRYKAFRCQPEMHWKLQDDDTFPYFFGAVRLSFWVPKALREDDNG